MTDQANQTVGATPAAARSGGGAGVFGGNAAVPMASLALAVVMLIAWQYLPPALGIPKFIIPRVSELWDEGVRMWQQENLLTHFISTASMSILGFVLGGLLGAIFGYALGLLPTWERVLSPYILALQIAPKVAFAPLFILWFGYNAWPKLIVTILVVFFPILVNVLQAMRIMDRDLVNLARAYNMSPAKIFWKVMVPFSMPNLMAGLRIGATLAVIGITVGELVGGEIGLGYLISFGQGQANTAMVFDAILLLTVIGIVMYWAVTSIETRVLHYVPRALEAPPQVQS
ncbi:ABC transporter permease [Rhodoplanes sp. Z2-YC6860]|uniref:ABC transporter permease n=1 Tax=Rhodoplanes sp. Z2-YC6860 TaxID=674703 RepID=UPI00078C0BCE|nr:ABC transporter permease [Rhodoplanes sp. Z2-YC6860]AMN39268.1 ABC transporter permease [Rhodoplanes sp. Z2-YC6860]